MSRKCSGKFQEFPENCSRNFLDMSVLIPEHVQEHSMNCPRYFQDLWEKVQETSWTLCRHIYRISRPCSRCFRKCLRNVQDPYCRILCCLIFHLQRYAFVFFKVFLIFSKVFLEAPYALRNCEVEPFSWAFGGVGVHTKTAQRTLASPRTTKNKYA